MQLKPEDYKSIEFSDYDDYKKYLNDNVPKIFQGIFETNLQLFKEGLENNENLESILISDPNVFITYMARGDNLDKNTIQRHIDTYYKFIHQKDAAELCQAIINEFDKVFLPSKQYAEVSGEEKEICLANRKLLTVMQNIIEIKTQHISNLGTRR